jgi:membrane peptidoglycan carboxypeptidase
MARLPWRTIITSIVGIGLLGVIVFTYFVITTPIPAPSDISRANSTIVYYSDGKTELGRIGEYNRTEVPLSKIPLQLQRAVLAAEDKDFYNHGGFSITGIARAVIGNLTSGFNAGGGSTITQQYAKNAYLTQERSIKRKVKELVLAVKLESSSSKDMILQNYLNVSYMGRGAYGMQTAARVYFAKDVSQLTISESAMLAALLKSPEGFAPEKRLSRLKARWNYVLDQMVDAGWLTESKRKEQQFPIVIERVNANTLSGPNGYALDMVKRELIGQGYDDATLGIAGMRVVSTFDADAQVAAVRAVEKEGPKSGTDGLRIGLAAVRPGTGEVIAVYGGPDFATEPLNNATQAIGQAGSTFKPFALAAATEAGVGLDTSLPGKSGTVVAGYRVVNYSNESYGPISLLYATEHSVNSAYVTLTYNIGVDAVMNAASRAGIPDNTAGIERNLTFVLGTASPHVIDVADAYATFAARGVKALPFTIKEVRSSNGGIIYQAAMKNETVFEQYVADTVNSALQRVVTNGTGFAAAKAGRPVAGKTGTTNDNMSAWFAGYSPDLAAAVMLVKEDAKGVPVTLRGTGGLSTVTGGSFPARIWTAFMKAALKKLPATDFVEPVEPLPVDTATPTPTDSQSPDDAAQPISP